MRKLFGMGRQIRAAKPVGSLKGSDNRKIDESASPSPGGWNHGQIVDSPEIQIQSLGDLVMNQKMKVIHDTRVKM